MFNAIDRDYAHAREPLDAEIGKAARIGNRRRRRLSLAGQRRLGERRALVRGMPFFADQRQRAAPAILAQRNRGARPRLPRADDDNAPPRHLPLRQAIWMNTRPPSTLTG